MFPFQMCRFPQTPMLPRPITYANFWIEEDTASMVSKRNWKYRFVWQQNSFPISPLEPSFGPEKTFLEHVCVVSFMHDGPLTMSSQTTFSRTVSEPSKWFWLQSGLFLMQWRSQDYRHPDIGFVFSKFPSILNMSQWDNLLWMTKYCSKKFYT